MEKPREKKTRLLKWTAITIIAILIASIILYRLYVQAPTNPELDDPENDVVLNVGTEYPGMIDVVHATLEVDGKALKITINVVDPISDLGDGGYAQWNVTLILENETLRMYEVCTELNSTRLSGYVAEIGDSKVQSCQVEYYKNSLTLRAPIDDLQSAKKVEWFILTTFERYSGDELITNGSDIAPDDGLQSTVLKG